MNYLLDTHTFLWASTNPQNLSPVALTICQDTSQQLWLSVASLWELQIKMGTTKLTLPEPFPDFLRKQRKNLQLKILPIKVKHIWQVGQLPLHHRDPFDRMLIAQAMVEAMPFISADGMMFQYPVKTIW